MAKIDTSTIEGYANMTAEQKLAALEAFNVPDPDYTGYVKKDVLDKATHDAAEWKKKYNSTLSEAEKAANDQAESMANMKAELDALRTQSTTNSYIAQYTAQGYDAELAASTAKALVEGDMETVFANQKTFLDGYAKRLKADAMKATHRPPPGADEGGDVDYAKKAQDAVDRGDHAEAAKFFRLKAMQDAKKAEG